MNNKVSVYFFILSIWVVLFGSSAQNALDRVDKQVDLQENADRVRYLQFGELEKTEDIAKEKDRNEKVKGNILTENIDSDFTQDEEVVGEQPGIWGKREGPGIWGKREGPGIWGKREGPGIWGKRANPGMWGKRSEPGIWGKRAGPGIWGKRAGPGIWGKRTEPGIWGKRTQSGMKEISLLQYLAAAKKNQMNIKALLDTLKLLQRYRSQQNQLEDSVSLNDGKRALKSKKEAFRPNIPRWLLHFMGAYKE